MPPMTFRLKKMTCLCSVALLMTLSNTVAAKGTGNVFISSEKDNSIIVLDGKTHEVIKRIGTAARPRHLQFNPDKTLIYAACGDGDAIDIIDVEQLALTDRIAGIDDPELFDFGPEGKIMYISLEDDGELGILNLEQYLAERAEKPELTVAEAAPEGEAAEDDDDDDDDDDDNNEEDNNDENGEKLPGMTTVEVGKEPEGILVSPDGKTAWVTSEVANTVHVVDTATQTMKANILVGNRPRRFALTPDQKELWVSNELSGSISIIDPNSNKVVDTIEFLPPGFRKEDVTPVGITLINDGKTAVVALGRANHVAFVDVVSRNIEDYVLVGKRAWNATLNPKGTTLYVANGLSDDISLVDVTKRKVIQSIPVARVPHTVLVDD